MRQRLTACLNRERLRRLPLRLKGASPGLRRKTGVITTLLVIASIIAMVILPATTSASYVNVLTNGGFEHGFSSQTGCGMVGSGWQCFTNGGAANYGFYDDQWDRTVAEGNHSQLIEVNTKNIMVGDADRYAGIYQTVAVVDWADYTLSLKGMIRTTSMDGDPWRYRVQVGWTFGPYPNWGAVNNWQDVGWDTYYERTDPGAFLSYSTNLMAESDYVTVYIRAWKKWGTPNEEIDINLDAIALTGPSPYYYEHKGYPVEPVYPVDPGYEVHPPVGGPVDPGYGHPVDPGYDHYPQGHPDKPDHGYYPPIDNGVCMGPERVYNGGFEMGFNPVAVGHVGNSWGFFTNGGGANYGFYDDQWTPVVAEGKHSQLIEINTKNVYPLDNDRYAGIYQYITGLQPGATYEFSMKGLLRGAGNEDDPYRFAAQVGYLAGYSANWSHVDDWTEMNLGPISKRTEPGAMGHYSLRFVAPASDITLFIRGWKKWGIPDVEMDFNIDAVSVRDCLLYTGGPVEPVYPVHPDYRPVADGCGDYKPDYAPDGCGDYVKPGYPVYPDYPTDGGCGDHGQDYDPYGCDGYVEPDYPVYPDYPTDGGCGDHGQDYDPYGCDGYPPSDHPGQPEYGGCSYVVQPGDTLAWIARVNGVSVYELIAVNNIANPDLIYVGQHLVLPGCAAPEPYHPVVDPVYPPVDPVYPHGDPVHPPRGETYVVQPGDTLSQIAAWYGVNVWTLCQVNGISNPNIVYVGQVLVIP